MVDRSQTSGGTSSYRRQAARKAAFAPFRFHDLSATCSRCGAASVSGSAESTTSGYGSVSVTEIDLRFLDGDAAQIARAA